MGCQWKDKVLAVTEKGFEALALELFQFQYANNEIYRAYVNALNIRPDGIRSLPEIPFLPIRFFKTHRVTTTAFEPVTVFESSGTTGTLNSRHFIRDRDLYVRSFSDGFKQFYGDIGSYCLLGLLPSYLERGHSSLVLMVDELIRRTNHPDSGFYLHDFDKLYHCIRDLEQRQQRTLLIGVTFALLDFAEYYRTKTGGKPLSHTIIMETGGMKGRRREMVRQEVHEILMPAFGVNTIHSEYGMTELLSQAYSGGGGLFHSPPWMKILLREEEDPLQVWSAPGNNSNPVRGAINVIDLANVYSCCFIATDDAGKLYNDGSFEVAGRLDNSDLRGCSLLAL